MTDRRWGWGPAAAWPLPAMVVATAAAAADAERMRNDLRVSIMGTPPQSRDVGAS